MRSKIPDRPASARAEVVNLRARLAEAEETLDAIRTGHVDALVVTTAGKEQVFTLEGAETSYRFLIEEMNEAALLLGPEGIIRYANARFAEWTNVPLEQIIGASWDSFFAPAEQGQLQHRLRAAKTGSIRTEAYLRNEHGAPRPVGLSLSWMKPERIEGFSVVVTDLTVQKQTEEALRSSQGQLQTRAESLEKTVQERTVELQATNEMLQKEMDDRKRLEREVLTSVEREQRRLGQDLHDDLCQQLTAIEFFSQTLARSLGKKDKAAAQKAKQIAEMVRLATLQTRDLARGLSPLSLEADGLSLALKELAERTARVFGLECRYTDHGPALVPDQAMGMHIYRIAQEAVTNAVKHSQAGRVEIGLTAQGAGLTLRVSDNGVGISPESGQGSGMGLRIMKYRAGIIGGSLLLEAAAGGGTSVTCHISDGLLPPQERSRR